MRSWTRVAAVVVAAAAIVGPATTAGAEERTCRGALGRVTVDNLRVPARATCSLTGTTVKGTIKVESGATLRANGVRVIGNVQAERHRSVTLTASRVGGSVQLEQGGTASVARTTITGDLQSFTNRGGQSFVSNRMNGNLQCKSNVPAPTGRSNVVQGNKEDQCRKL
jgi:hypothetical protein